MYLLLLVFGVVLGAAGLVLTAAGVSLHDRTFDMTIVTPGVVALVGGFLLIGLGLALRVLQRIEYALALRPILPPVALHELPQTPMSKPTAHPVAATPAVSADERRVEHLPEHAPTAAGLEATAEPEETELSLPPMPSSVDVAVAEADKARGAKRKNGAAPGRLAPRLDVNPRSAGGSGRATGPSFDSLWPKGPRPMRGATPAPTQVAAAPAVEAEPDEPVATPAQTPAPDAAVEPEPVSVLKSGVVDGMAYTLYSDGSIEAQLPQGTLRFGSITELRNHIEQSA